MYANLGQTSTQFNTESFDPPPKVDSSVVRLTPLPTPLVPTDQMSGFAELVSAAFAQRRKTLRNNLKGRLDAAQINALDIDPGTRSEMLSLQQFISLHEAVRETAS